MPEKNQSLNLVLNDEGKFSSAVFYDASYEITETVSLNRDRESALKIKSIGNSNFNQTNRKIETIEKEYAFNWTESMASREGRKLEINGKEVTKKEFDRTLMNARLIEGLKVSEIEEIREAGGMLAKKAEKIISDNEITEKEFDKLEKLDKKAKKALERY